MSTPRITLSISRELRTKLEYLQQFFALEGVSTLQDVIRRVVDFAYEIMSRRSLVVVCPRCGTVMTLRDAYSPYEDSDGYHIAFKCRNCGEEVELDKITAKSE